MQSMLSQRRPLAALAVGLAGCGTSGGGASTESAPTALVFTTPDANPQICEIPMGQSPTAFLFVTNLPVNCAQASILPAPTPSKPSSYPDCTHGTPGPAYWGACLELPTLAPATIDLEPLNGTGNMGYAAFAYAAADCSGFVNGETFAMGTLTIETVDPSSVTFTLSGTDQPTKIGGEITPDGTYQAPRCP